MPMSFAETALASGLGAAVGAWAAFRFNLYLETRKSRNAEILAGHVALALFRSKLAYAGMVEEAWKAGQQNAGPGWWQFPAPRLFPEDLRRIDIESLAFLLAKGHPKVINDLIDAEFAYFDLMAALAAYRDFYTSKLHPAMLAAGVPETLTSVEATGNERKLPPSVLLKIDDLHVQLGVRVDRAPAIIRAATSDLRKALQSVFPRAKFDLPEPVGQRAQGLDRNSEL